MDLSIKYANYGRKGMDTSTMHTTVRAFLAIFDRLAFITLVAVFAHSHRAIALAVEVGHIEAVVLRPADA